MWAAVPLHRGALWITARAYARQPLLPRVLYRLRWNVDIMQADLVTVIQGWRAVQGEQEHHTHTGLLLANACCDAWFVVVAKHIVRPGCWRSSSLGRIHEGSQGPRSSRH